MDPVNIEKLQAMKRYRRRSKFLPTLIRYSLSVLMLGLFLSSPLWLPSACSSVELFFSVYLTRIAAIVFRPKCLLIVCNIIVIFLFGESRSSTASDFYEELMKSNQSLRRLSACESISESCLVEETRERDDEEEEDKVGFDREGLDEEERGLASDELKRRVEDFIARVNMQRSLEARMMVCCV